MSQHGATDSVLLWVSTHRSAVQRAIAAASVLALLAVGVLPLHPSPSAAQIVGVAALGIIAAAPPLYLWRRSHPRFDLRFVRRYFELRALQEAAQHAAVSAQLDVPEAGST